MRDLHDSLWFLLFVVSPQNRCQVVNVDDIFRGQLVTLNFSVDNVENIISLISGFTQHTTKIVTSIINFVALLTNRSSAEGPASGTLMSSRWSSWGVLSRLAGPCGPPNPIGPANAPKGPSGPSADGIVCGGAPGICCAWICCCKRLKRFSKYD